MIPKVLKVNVEFLLFLIPFVFFLTTSNESQNYTLNTKNYMSLNQHTHNCEIAFDLAIIITCEDGYVYLNDFYSFLDKEYNATS